MKDVIVVENFLSEDECAYYRKIIDDGYKKQSLQLIAKREDIVNKFIADHLDDLRMIDLSGVTTKGVHNDVTLSRSSKAIPRHKDKVIRKDDKWKLLIYLNDIKDGGGTIFYETMKTKEGFKVNNKMGSAVFFDITLPHAGERISEMKYTIGFRLII